MILDNFPYAKSGPRQGPSAHEAELLAQLISGRRLGSDIGVTTRGRMMVRGSRRSQSSRP